MVVSGRNIVEGASPPLWLGIKDLNSDLKDLKISKEVWLGGISNKVFSDPKELAQSNSGLYNKRRERSSV